MQGRRLPKQGKSGKKWSPAMAFTARVNATRCIEAMESAQIAEEDAHSSEDWAEVNELYKSALAAIPKGVIQVETAVPLPTKSEVQAKVKSSENSMADAQIREAKEADAAKLAARKAPKKE
eukprot:COSAG05_NODE_647_length_8113_cov_15.485900_6_plen_121_part_00